MSYVVEKPVKTPISSTFGENHPTIVIKETIGEITLSKGQHIDIYTVDHDKQENGPFIKVCQTVTGETIVFVERDRGNVRVVDWTGGSASRRFLNMVEEGCEPEDNKE